MMGAKSPLGIRDGVDVEALDGVSVLSGEGSGIGGAGDGVVVPGGEGLEERIRLQWSVKAASVLVPRLGAVPGGRGKGRGRGRLGGGVGGGVVGDGGTGEVGGGRAGEVGGGRIGGSSGGGGGVEEGKGGNEGVEVGGKKRMREGELEEGVEGEGGVKRRGWGG